MDLPVVASATMICGEPLASVTPVTTPEVSELLPGVTCTMTEVPMRLFACNIESEDDICVLAVNVENCAICDAICVSDCGLDGS